MRSSDGLTPKRRAVWNVVRHFVPGRTRWFYEGSPPLRGQLWYSERKLLYRTIKELRPAVNFEIGTWKGGGSTLFIAQALHENGIGQLHTIETDKALFDEARDNYHRLLPHLAERVVFHHGDYRKVYAPVLQAHGSIDFVFLDGAEDADQTMSQYRFFQPYLKPGSIMMAHDWFTEKCDLLRKEIEQDAHWKVVAVLTPPRSVGLMLASRRPE